MIEEYNYLWKDRNDKGEDEHGDFEWVELPDWDDPAKTRRFKKYKDIDGILGKNNY